MIPDYFYFFRRNLQYLFILAIWILSIIRNHGGNVYYSTISAIIIYIPFITSNLSLSQHFILIPSLILLFSTITLTNFDLSYQIFIIFLNVDTIIQIKNMTLYAILDIIIFGFSIFQTGCTDLRYIILVLTLNFCSCYMIDIATNFQFIHNGFTFFTACISSFLQCSTGQQMNTFVFLFSLFLSLPHFPLPVPPQRISYENFKVIIYIILTLLCNIIAIEYGILYNALTIISDAMMSMCNCVTMIGEIIADIASYMPPTKNFPYGFKRGIIICDFTVTILLTYVTFDLISSAISTLISYDFTSSMTNSNNNSSSILLSSSPSLVSSLLSLFASPAANNANPLQTNSSENNFLLLQDIGNTSQSITNGNINDININSKNPMELFYVALLGMLNNLFGLFFLGTIHFTTCTIAEDGNSMSVFSDFISSLSVVLCSILSVFFKIDFIDPFISIFISLMIFSLSISRMFKLFKILMQSTPDYFEQREFLAGISDNMDNVPQYNAWSLDEKTNVVTFQMPKKKSNETERIREKIKNILQNDPNLILTYEN